MSSLSVTCPPQIRINNHHRNLRSIWNTKEWRTESAAYKARHPAKCSRCGKEGPIIPGHCEEDYNDMPSYIQKVREDKVEPLCPRCNQQESKGKHPCPVCIVKHKANPEHRINYITQDQEQCRQCEPDYNPETSKFRHEQGNRIKSRLARENYRAHHPGKKIVNGMWVYAKPAPAMRGYEHDLAPMEIGKSPCVFLLNDRCTLHKPGLKPYEGRFCRHDTIPEQETGMMESLKEAWNTKAGQGIARDWIQQFYTGDPKWTDPAVLAGGP